MTETGHQIEYDVIMRDGTVELIVGADAYQQEGQMTTFFRTDAGRSVIDCWATRIASVRTAEIQLIRRRAAVALVADLAA